MDNSHKINNIKQKWIIFCVSFAGFMATLDDYIVNVSLPAISRDFNVGTSEVAQVTLIYLLVLVSSLPLFGKIGDRIGFKKVFMFGYFIFTTGSLLCGISTSIHMLIACRCIQGIGASMLSVTGPAIIAKYVTPEVKGSAFGLMSTMAALGITLGAPLGGIITGFFSWHWIFFINIPLGIIAMFLANKIMPDEEFKKSTEKLDFIGAGLSFTGLSFFLYGLNQFEELGGWKSPVVFFLLIFSAIFLILFYYRETAISNPLVNMNLFKNKEFLFANFGTVFAYMLLAGCNFLLPFYLILIKGYTTAQTGFIMIIYSIVYVIMTPFAGRYSDRIHPRLLCITGMLIAAADCAFFAVALKLNVFWPVILYLVIRAVAYALFISPNNKLIMDIAPDKSQGVTSAILKISINLSLVLGVCIYETVFSLPIPEGIGSLQTFLKGGKIAADLIIKGFTWSYLFGAVTCLLAFFFTFISVKKNKSILP